MCGIAGLASRDQDRVDRIEAMTACLRHRGPDASGIEHFPAVSLGHRRLSVIDLEGGRQPMLGSDGGTAVVYNGEIYNYRELRERLARNGGPFRTSSDTEVLLRLYEALGVECVDHLEGMFAFAIWDDARRRLFMARDHLGQKPLYWTAQSGEFAFASEIKGILESGLVDRRLDLRGLYDFVSLRYLPDDLTLFDGVRKLPAGHRLVWEGGRVRTDRYWSPSPGERLTGDDASLLDRLDDELQATVARHLVSDVPVGSFLSGGIDSSLITAMAATRKTEPHPTFTVGVEERDFDEMPFARQVAERYGTEHHERVVRADLVGLLPEMVRHLEEPADPFGVGVYLASSLASEHVKAVLSGDGGDELFAGYDRYAGQRLADLYALLPGWFRSRVVGPAIERIPETFTYKSLAQKLRWIQAMADRDGGRRYAHAMSFLRFTDDAKLELFTDGALASVDGGRSSERILEHFRGCAADDVVQRMLYTDLVTRIPGHLLPIVDRMAMAHGLEVRVPFLEHQFVEFALALPTRLKLRGRTLKYGLREVGRRHLSAEIVDRPKQGFGFPLGQWYRGALRPVLEEVIGASRLVDEGLLRREYMERLLRQHLEGAVDHSYRLWILLGIEVWYRHFLDGLSVDDLTGWLRRPMGAPVSEPA